jgi:fluoroacetyl-CoA thioesterase
MRGVNPGLVGRVSWEATERHSARAWGSGAVPVFSTPSLVGVMETAAMEALKDHLDEDETTVGTKIEIEHTAATPLGDTIRAEARLVGVEGRKLVFEVEARDSVQSIGRGRHERVVVSRERFLAKLRKA